MPQKLCPKVCSAGWASLGAVSLNLAFTAVACVDSDVLLRHRRRCHPEAEAIREANALLDSQAEGGSMPAPSVTSGRAKLKAAGLTKRAQAKSKQVTLSPVTPALRSAHFLTCMQQDDASSSPEAMLPPEVTSLNREMSSRLVHGPSPPSLVTQSTQSADSSVLGFNQLFSVNGSSTSLTRSTPDAQSIISLDAPASPTSFTGGSSAPAWGSLPPLSMFNTNAILPKSGSEVTQFGNWYAFPPRRQSSGVSPVASTIRGDEETVERPPVDPVYESYLLGDTAVAEQLQADLLYPERNVLNAEGRFINMKRGGALVPTDKFLYAPRVLSRLFMRLTCQIAIAYPLAFSQAATRSRTGFYHRSPASLLSPPGLYPIISFVSL